MKNWYAVHCKPGQDARAEAHLSNQQFEVYRPLARVRKRCRGEMKNAIESLFPRYLFVHLDNATGDWTPIRSTRGVAGLVKFRNYPAVVPSQIIDGLRARADNRNCVDFSAHRYKQNQPVRIVEGPFSGYEGIFHARRGEDRVVVLLNVMQQAQKLLIPETYIDPL